MTGGVRPFSNGTQYADWTDVNCGTCAKGARPDGVPACPIEYALALAAVGDGVVRPEVAGRMGDGAGRYTWPCREHERRGGPAPGVADAADGEG